jgi:AcrR family transcriptional regulator
MLDVEAADARTAPARTRRRVLDAAAALLARKGYTALTVEAIAAEAGVAKTTLYRWWPSKAAVLVDLYTELAGALLVDLDTGSAERDLVNLFRGIVRLFRDTPAGLAMAGMIAEAQLDPAAAALFREGFMPTRRAVTDAILRRGVERGELRPDLDVEAADDFVSGAFWYRLLLGHAPLDEAFAERVVRYTVAGMRAAEPK